MQQKVPSSRLRKETDPIRLEILTQERELATNYRYHMSLGLSYRFGSIFSDVVNPRFEGI